MGKQIVLPTYNYCFGCGACKESCPVNCITMEKDIYDCIYPKLDVNKCIKCGNCEQHCPALHNMKNGTIPQIAYAAWNKNQEERENAASGGIATAIYHYALDNNYKTFGVEYIYGKGIKYFELKSTKDIEKCRNSKYVFSNISYILPLIKAYLLEGQTVIIPALPCQAASIRAFTKNITTLRLIIIDIVCHGICPEEYLTQHLSSVAKNKNIKKIFFRDSEYGTNRFILSLRDIQNKVIYKAKVDGKDVYQIGYHKALIYRENCYNCEYACPERVGDITISDFSGLGKCEPFTSSRKSVSCVLVSSLKGQQLVNTLQAEGYIEMYKRPIEEALQYEKQLKAPSIPHDKREIFKKEYEIDHNFERSAKAALVQDIRINRIRNFFRTKEIRELLAKTVPKRIKRIIKKKLRK